MLPAEVAPARRAVLRAGAHGPEALEVLRLQGTEAVSAAQPFQMNVVLTGVRPDRFLADVLGGPARLTLREPTVAGAAPGARRFQGVIAAARELAADAGRARAWLGVTLAPRLWLLGHRRRRRVFQDRTAPEILAEVLGAAGVDHTWTLARPAARRPLCAQLDETDLELVTRLAAEEGAAFTIDDPPEDEAGREVVRFFAIAGHGWPLAEAARIPVRAPDATGAWAAEGFDRFTMEVRTEAAGGDPVTGFAEGRCLRLAPGRRFTLEQAGDLPDRDSPARARARDFLVMEVAHELGPPAPPAPPASGQGDIYKNRIRCVPADAVAPAPQPAQRVGPALEAALVVGAAGEEIVADALGRIEVRFPWEDVGPGGAQRTCRLPVLGAWGRERPLRGGMEVAVAFVGGDASRPVALGALPDAVEPPPSLIPSLPPQVQAMPAAAPPLPAAAPPLSAPALALTTLTPAEPLSAPSAGPATPAPPSAGTPSDPEAARQVLWARMVRAVARLPPELAARGEAIQAQAEAAVKEIAWLAGDIGDLERDQIAVASAPDSGPVSRQLDVRATILTERATRARRAVNAALAEVEAVADERLGRVRAAAEDRLRAALAEAEGLVRRLREGGPQRRQGQG